MTQPYPAEAVERLRERVTLALERDESATPDVAPDDLAALLSYVEGMEREADNYTGAMADLESLIECCERVCVENDIPGLRKFLALNYPRHIGLAPAPTPPHGKDER